MTPPLPASIELAAAQVVADPALADLIPPGTRVYLPDLGSETWSVTVAAARRLTDCGLRPVPHVAARRCPSQEALTHWIGTLAETAGIRDTLLIGGDAKRPVGPFSSTLDLLETGVIEKFGIEDVGLAGHPEGSPAAPSPVLDEALERKRQLLARTDARIRIVTQFGFDAHRFAAWADVGAAAYPGMSIHMGIAGPAKITTLMRYAALCGVGNSLSFLRKQTGSIRRLALGFDPEEIAAPLEAHVAAQASPSIVQLHVFTFGGLERTSAWLFERGSWSPGAPADHPAK